MIRPALRRAIVLLASHRPREFYGTIEQLARVTAPFARQRATVRRVQSVFPHLGRAEAHRVARELRCSSLKSRALGVALVGARGEPVYPPVGVASGLSAVRGPAILAAFHTDAFGALGEAVRRVPGEVSALHRMEWVLPSGIVGLYVERSDVGGAATFHRALATLRRGGCVLLLVDGPGAAGHTVSLLGRAAVLWRGAFALARMTGAPIIPLLAGWNGAVVDIACGQAIAASDDEAGMAHALAGELERHLLEHPAGIGDLLLEQLSRSSRQPMLRAAP